MGTPGFPHREPTNQPHRARLTTTSEVHVVPPSHAHHERRAARVGRTRPPRSSSPTRVEWCDGSDEEYDRLCAAARRRRHLRAAERRQAARTATSPCPTPATSPGSRTAPSSAPSTRSTPARPTTGATPAEMKAELLGLYRGAMKGRTMYVVPFSMGPLGSPIAHIGVQLTDSPYVAVNMRIMTRMGQGALDVLGRRRVRAVPALGRLPARRRRRHTRAPTCRGRATPRTSTSSTSPRPARSGRYGSGYGGNALLGKKCFALRIASTMARDDGWMAEHMLDPRHHPARTARRSTSPPRSRRPAARPTWPC